MKTASHLVETLSVDHRDAGRTRDPLDPRDLAPEPGVNRFVDDHRVVSGRRSFQPRYDGRDRRMERIGVTRDLRRSRAPGAAVAPRPVG